MDLRQKNTFDARLKRLAVHAGNTNATLHIGMDEQLPQAAFARRGAGAGLKVARYEPYMLILGLISGALSWIWAQWMRVHMMAVVDPAVALVSDLAIGLTAVLLLRAIFGLRGLTALMFQLIGMAVAILGLHNMVHLWPERFAQIFPPAWVNSVLSQTEPMSVNLSAFAL